ncbi:hypothetical protein KGD82_26335 [Nocardiopsis eucommiae]|uniref:Uncharacterized protein n=1 Tax=Nocardiopsis eucommiae TaxID=2831970 RepID=A0A975QKJ0_9ACTN|nr:hypothetical protein KGD82_26335 [Nocardiopsis eucommiae]
MGFTPFATKQTETQGDSTSFGEENKVSLPGSTVDVTTFDRFDVDTTIRTRWNLGVSLPFSKTVDGNGNVLRRGSAAEGLGDRNPPPDPDPDPDPDPAPDPGPHPEPGGERPEPRAGRSGSGGGHPAHHTANGQTDSRFRVLDLAQKGALPGTAGLDSALERSRSVPDDIRVVPGREGSGHALNNIDSAAALDSINRAVRDNRLELTDQSQRDIRAALSPNNTRGLNLRYQTGGLALEVRFRNEFMGEQRPSKGGWILLKLGPDGGPVFGPVESGMSSERSVSQSTEHNDSEGKQKKHGVTATLDGGVNPTQSIGTDSSGDPTFPKDRYQSFAPNTGTGLESGTTKTHLTSDTETESRSRTVKAPGATGNTPTRFDFTVSVEDGKVFSSHADVGSRTEVYPAGTFQPTPPASRRRPPRLR